MNNEELNNTTTEELENTAAETEEEFETQEGDLIGTIIGTAIVAGITALAIKIFKKKPEEPVDDGKPKKKRWRRSFGPCCRRWCCLRCRRWRRSWSRR